MSYTPLHLHTSRGSLLDSINTPESIVKRAKEIGLGAVAITDHGNCSNHLNFYKECKANDIKPLLGMEGYVTADMEVKDTTSTYYHIIMIAINQEGYKNLLKITSLGHVKGFYRKPRVDLQTIRKYGLGKGIIATSACIGGEVPQMILKSVNKVEIHDKIQEYKDTFEEFYLEVQPTNIGINEEQKQINTAIQELSYETNTECVVTSDCHFTNKEDFELHNIFIQISIDRDNEVYKDCWLKSLEEVKDGLNYLEYQFVESCIENTNKIADKCNVELDIGHGQVPTAEIPDGLTLDKYFYNLIVQGCRDKGFQNFDKDKKKLYWDRIKHEYHVMVEKGFVHYFLLLYEIFQDASKENIIISPTARGSGASSLICYVLGITNVDPIKYNLIFERFLTMEKKGLPD